MKTRYSLIASLLLVLSAGAQSVNWDTWSWSAPEPALANTQWWDYGWDSSSNGPIPAELARRRSELRMANRLPSPAPPALPGQSVSRPVNGKIDEADPPKKVGIAYNEPKPGRVYVDSFLSLRTPNFLDADYGYGIGVGYQVNKYWSGEIRVLHHGLDADGSAIQDLGGRLVARMPFEFLAPYTFLGASFDLENDAWHLEPGGGIELGVHQSLKGLSIFGEAGLDADLHGRSGYKFTSGIRIRF